MGVGGGGWRVESLSFVFPPLPGGACGGWACRFLLWQNPQETAETDNGRGAAC